MKANKINPNTERAVLSTLIEAQDILYTLWDKWIRIRDTNARDAFSALSVPFYTLECKYEEYCMYLGVPNKWEELSR